MYSFTGWRRANPDDAAPWKPDRDAQRCGKCENSFTLVRRRHHCRACGNVFCSQCSSARAPVRAYKGVCRVCVVCISVGGDALYGGTAGATSSSAESSSQSRTLPSSTDGEGEEEDIMGSSTLWDEFRGGTPPPFVLSGTSRASSSAASTLSSRAPTLISEPERRWHRQEAARLERAARRHSSQQGRNSGTEKPGRSKSVAKATAKAVAEAEKEELVDTEQSSAFSATFVPVPATEPPVEASATSAAAVCASSDRASTPPKVRYGPSAQAGASPVASRGGSAICCAPSSTSTGTTASAKNGEVYEALAPSLSVAG